MCIMYIYLSASLVLLLCILSVNLEGAKDGITFRFYDEIILGVRT